MKTCQKTLVSLYKTVTAACGHNYNGVLVIQVPLSAPHATGATHPNTECIERISIAAGHRLAQLGWLSICEADW